MGGDGERLVTVHVTTDPVEGEMLTELLHGEAIPAHLSHVNAPLLGAGTQLFNIEIAVPAELAARARALLSELEHVGAVEEFASDGGVAAATADADGERPTPARRARLAAGIALMIPGGGHLHARRPLTALVVGGGLVAALVALVWNRHQAFVADLLFAVAAAIVICEAVGGLLAARAYDPARPAPPARQIARGVVLLVIAAGVGGALATAANAPAWLRERSAGALAITCDEHGIDLLNHGDGERVVTLDHLRMTAPDLAVQQSYPVEVVGPSRFLLAPGQSARVGLVLPPSAVADCASPAWAQVRPRRSTDCLLAFDAVIEDARRQKILEENVALCSPLGRGLPQRAHVEARPAAAR